MCLRASIFPPPPRNAPYSHPALPPRSPPMAPSLSTTLAGLSLESCIFNASGPRSGTDSALSKVATSRAGAILAKSATIEEQTGNPLPRTWQCDGVASMNSEGLPNKGIDYYLAEETITSSKAGTDKPYLLSISGHTLADNVEMLKRMGSNPLIDAVELNLACPNVIGHPIIACVPGQRGGAAPSQAGATLRCCERRARRGVNGGGRRGCARERSGAAW